MKYQTPNTVGNFQCTAYFKRLRYDATLKRKVIIYAVEYGNRTGCKFTISKANFHRTCFHNFVEGSHQGVHKKPLCGCWSPPFCQREACKMEDYNTAGYATETAKPFGITNFKSSARFVQEIRVPWRNVTQVSNIHLSKDCDLFSGEAAELPAISYSVEEEAKLWV
jgi:hypothetical protein